MRATAFKGCYYSSFSDAIMRMRVSRGTASERDEHDVTLPSWHRAFAGTAYDASLALNDPLLAKVAGAAEGPEAAEAVAALRQAKVERDLEVVNRGLAQAEVQ